MRRSAIAVIAVAMIVTGCASGKGANLAETSPAPTTQAAPDQTPPAVPESEPVPEKDAGVAAVGSDQWFTYDDGIELQVTALEPMTLGEYALTGNRGDPGVVVVVTISNGSDAVFDAALADVLLSHGPNGDAAEREYEEPGFTGSIPPDQTLTARYDFGVVPVEHYGDILVEASPSWDHEPAFFTGAVAS
ncbi:MAG: hypothetical protein ACRD0W_00865 [Acidimicrobiales bacterium]